MKLITSFLDNSIQYLTEEKGSTKNVFIEGVFMQCDVKNRNARVYPKNILKNAVEKYVREQVETGRAVGELNHPEGPSINLDKVSHRITELKFEGSDVYGKALILDTPMGKIVKGLVDGGVKLGVSSRGMGSVDQKEGYSVVKDDFILSTIDIVQDPSAPGAFVNGIMEGMEYFFENNKIIAVAADKAKSRLKKMSTSQITETKAHLFAEFLREVSAK
jgi:hypothetical protein